MATASANGLAGLEGVAEAVAEEVAAQHDQRDHCFLRMPNRTQLFRPRPFPAVLPEIVSSDACTVCTVHYSGTISFQRRVVFVSEALRGLLVGVRPTSVDGVFVRFGDRAIKRLDLRQES